MVVKSLCDSRTSFAGEEGFTLIESVVAMGLFAGAVFLLVTVFSSFTLDDYPSKTQQALAIAQTTIARTENGRRFIDFSKDTLGFRLKQHVQVNPVKVSIYVSVGSISNPALVYARLSDLWATQ